MPDHLSGFRSASARFAGLLAHGDLDAPIRSCPGWSLAELAEHVGGIHEWGRHAIVAGTPDAVLSTAPRHRSGLVSWYAQTAADLLATLEVTHPDTPAWGFGPKPRTTAFWRRRQAHEVTLHLWDAAASQGAGASQDASAAIDHDVALDGVDEVLTVFFPRQVRLGRMPLLKASLALVTESARDGGSVRRWVLAGDGTGPAGAANAPAQATLSGAPQELLLVLWGRLALPDSGLTVEGDAAAADAVLAAALTP